MDTQPEMLDFLKALAHADRLRIVGMLVQGPADLSTVAAGLSLPIRQVYDHLAFLKFVGVVREVSGQYHLDTSGLEVLARARFEVSPPAPPPVWDTDPARARVLATYLARDGTIRRIPNSITKAAAFRIVLEYLQAAFEPGAFYTEKEVNLVIGRFHQDVAGLRRDLVDAGLLARKRDGSSYWRPDPQEAS